MFVHPAVLLLLRYRAIARVFRLTTRMADPRRLLLTGLAIVLAMFWLGNVALSVVLREPLDPATVREGLVLGLLAYACWHVLKLVYHRPEQGVEWTPAEQALLCAKPLTRRDLVVYRFLVILASAALKAGIFTVLMLPDLPQPTAGFVGMLLALLFLDLLRMVFEITAWGISDHLYRRLRVGVVLIAAATCVSGLIIAVGSPAANAAADSPGSLKLLMHLLGAGSRLADTIVGQVAQAPFRVFAELVLAERYGFALAGWLLLALGLVAGAGCFTLWLDAYSLQAVHDRQRAAYSSRRAAAQASASAPLRLRRLPRGYGAGAIFWRQLLGARRHASSLLFALALPAGLSCLPWLTASDPNRTLWSVTAALAFYSFLLLPTALKSDFQRDLDRMMLLKSLPAHPLAVVVGQLSTPVLIASLLQWAVLTATVWTQQASLAQAAAAWLLLVAFDMIIFGMDNLIFLWFPYRLKQEGLFIFLRTTLVFTAKGLLFATALALIFAWATAAPPLAERCGLPGRLTFLAGLWLLLASAAAILLRLMGRAFTRFDPGFDVSA